MIKIITILAVIALSQAGDHFETVARDFDELPAKRRPQTRIVNGYEAVPKQFPYQALVMITDRGQAPFACGGSLLSANWVLSASHCLYQ